MLKYILTFFIVLLTQTSCTAAQEDEGGFKPVSLDPQTRERFEGLKRDFLQIEDFKIGTGPLAAFGRKITADVTIRYVSDGMVVYQGPILAYWGMDGSVFIHNSLRETGALSLEQMGILWGLNGMAVGGKRSFTIAPKLVCAWDGSEKSNPGATCGLVSSNKRGEGGMAVRKEALNVEATLTSSCAPLHRGGGRGKEDVCRNSDLPRRDPGDPIWRFYYAEPLQPHQ